LCALVGTNKGLVTNNFWHLSYIFVSTDFSCSAYVAVGLETIIIGIIDYY